MRIGGRQKLGAVVQSRCEIDPKSRAWLPVLSRPRGREAALMDFEVAPLSPALSFALFSLAGVLRRSVDPRSCLGFCGLFL